MKGNDRSARSKQMAAALKRAGVERTTGKCAVCYGTVSNHAMYGHYSQHARGVVTSVTMEALKRGL
jgi:hypothetical protein